MNDTLTCHEITKDFAGVRALAGVDLVVAPGRIRGLIGPNGSGKTTLVNCLSGVTDASSGSVTVDGMDVTGWAPERIARAGVTRTFQNLRLFPRMTARENVEVGIASASRWGRREGNRAIAARSLLVELGIASFEMRSAGELPYGVQRRVEIARALATEPRYLLLDEPAAGMNPQESDDLLGAIRDIRDRRGVGVLIIDHDLRLVMRLCDEVQVLHEGETIALGDPAAVRRHPQVIAAYLGREDVSSVVGDVPPPEVTDTT